nr:hypothetical protein [Tanacetum cinerariifolium]
MNKTLIEAARTMLADSLLSIPFWAEAVNTAYPLGKFDGKADMGFLVRYSLRSGPTWLFDIDTLTQSINYQPVVAGNQPNSSAGIQENFTAGTGDDVAFKVKAPESEVYVSPCSRVKALSDNFEEFSDNSTYGVNAASTPVTTVGPNSTNNSKSVSVVGHTNNVVCSNFELGGKSLYVDPSQYPDDPDMPALEDITYSDDEEDVGTEADFSNLEININVSLIPTTRVHKDHPVTQIIGDLSSAPQTRKPKRVHQDLKDPSWIEAMQEELLQFKIQKEESIDYEEVFAPVAGIEAIKLFLAYASFMDFMVYQMDVKSAFLYETIEKEVYVCQPPGFEDPDYPDKVYKVVKALYRLHQAPRACKDLCKAFEKLMKDKFQTSSMGELTFFLGLQVKQKQDGIFINQDKYVAKILRKFGLTDGKSASTPIDTKKPLLNDPDVKRLFRYLKGKPYLGLWYPKDSPFNLMAYSDSGYAGVSLDRKSTTGGCQFLEDYIIQALQLDDDDSVDCLPNEEIFAKLARIGYEKPSIKLTFYKAFFSAQWKFLIHKILQCMNEKRTAWNEFSSSMALEGWKWILRGGYTLFAGMLVPHQAKDVEDAVEDENAINEVSDEPTPPSPTPEVRKKETVQISRAKEIEEEEVNTKVPKDTDVQGRLEESQAKVYHLDLEHDDKVLSILETDEAEPAKVEEVSEVVTTAKFMKKVVTTATTPIIAASVPKASAPRRRRGLIIQDPEEAITAALSMQSDVKSKDKGKGILVEKPKPLKRQAQIEQDEAFARELEVALNANKGEKEIEEEESKRKSENIEQKVTKKQKIDEEVEELMTHLQIIANDEDDVYTKATPLALKVSVVN